MGIRSVARVAAGLMVAALLLSTARYATSFPLRISVFPSLQIDAQGYDAIALDLSNRWSQDAIPPLQPPGFVTFLAIVFTVFGHSWIAGRLSLWLCLVFITVLSFVVAKAMYRRESAGWCAALLCASSPALQAYTGTLQYELLASLILVALLGAAWRAPTLRSMSAQVTAAAGLGIALGLAVLTREVLAVLVPVIAAYVFSRMVANVGRRRAVGTAAFCLACATGPPLAWSVSQSAQMGRVVAVSDKGGHVLAYGNNPAANGTFNVALVRVPEPSGWAFIRSRPQQALRLAGRKALYFWGFLRDGWNVPRPSAMAMAHATAGLVPLQWILPWARGGWLLVLVLVALAFWRAEMWRTWGHIPAVIASVMAVHMLTVSSYRFAVPTLPLVLIIVSGPIAILVESIWRNRFANVAAGTVLVVGGLMQMGSWPFVYELSAAEFDGMDAADLRDHFSGASLRVADAASGRRPVLLLTDECLPKGAFTIDLSVRPNSEVTAPITGLFRVYMANLKGEVLCERTVTASELDPHSMRTISIPCELASTGPSTFVVETLGAVSLVFGSVRFAWSNAR